MSHVLRVVDVDVRYGKAIAVEGASIELTSGVTTALLGPNGAGKSSLFNAVAGVVPARAGRVELDGNDITSLSATERARDGLVLVPQGRQLFPRLTVTENLQVVADSLKCPRAALDEALDRFPILRERSKAIAGVLSGGEQQMLALARGLMSRPRVLLLDEPTLGLAPTIVNNLMKTVRSLAGDGIAVAIAEPSMQVVRGNVDRGVILIRGRVAKVAADQDELESSYRSLMSIGDGPTAH